MEGVRSTREPASAQRFGTAVEAIWVAAADLGVMLARARAEIRRALCVQV